MEIDNFVQKSWRAMICPTSSHVFPTLVTLYQSDISEGSKMSIRRSPQAGMFPVFFIIVCLLLYYKIRFDQLHNQWKSKIPNGKVVNKTREKLLLNLVNEHNQLAVEVFKLNMIMRKTFASLFINFAFTEITTLYLMFNTENLLIKLFAFTIFVLYFTFGSALSYLLSLVIKSAHQSLKLIHLVVCRYKMRLKLKLKVKFK